MDIITFNDKAFSDFNVFYDGSKLFDTPSKDIELYSIPGRSGDLSISNNRYNNLNISINCFIRNNFRENYSALINYLSSIEGYGKLETSKELDIYRLAQFNGSVQPETGSFLIYGNFELVFNCKPQKYLKIDENGIEVKSSATILNPSLMIAKPLIAVTGTGKITINDTVLTLSTNTGTTYIDCDIQDAYEGTINRNGNLTLSNGFPTLKAGSNTVSVSGCSIVLYPRWWRI